MLCVLTDYNTICFSVMFSLYDSDEDLLGWNLPSPPSQLYFIRTGIRGVKKLLVHSNTLYLAGGRKLLQEVRLLFSSSYSCPIVCNIAMYAVIKTEKIYHF